MKKLVLFSIVLAAFAFGQNQVYEITITNLTKSQIFSPPVGISHNNNYRMFQSGAPSSTPLYIMAEDGDNGPLIEDALANENVFDAQSAGGPLLPGQTVTFQVGAHPAHNYVSVAGMLVITNDTFFAINGARVINLPFKNGFGKGVTLMAEAYDAGSEANTESCDHIPGPPCGSGGVRVPEGSEGFVYISNGIHGIGDVASDTYDWRSVVARVSIRVTHTN